MRRPVLYTVGAFALGIVICHSFAIGGRMLFFLALPVAFVIIFTDNRIIPILLCALFLGGLHMDSYAQRPDPLLEMVGKEISFSGRVISAEKKGKEKYSIVVRAGDDSRCVVGIYAGFSDFDSCVGKKVTVRGELELPDSERNPGCFDYRAYLRTEGINTKMSISHAPKIGYVEDPLMNRIWVFRTAFQKTLEEHMADDAAAVAMAMIFGDKSSMDEKVYEEFQRNGTAHVLAVSGMHIGLIYGFFCIVTGGRRKPKVNVIIGACLLIYMAMVGFTPSVIRAVIMILIHILGDLTHRRYDLLSAGAASAFIMMIQNPFCIFHPGFQMSYLAVFSLSVGMNILKNKNISRWIGDMLLPSLIIQLAMIPYIAYNFNYISAGGIFANVPVIFLSGLIVPMGMAAIFSYLFFPPLEDMTFHMLEYLCDLMEKCNSVTYWQGAFTFLVTSPPLAFVIMFYFGFFFLLSDTFCVWKNRKKWESMAAVTILFSIMSIGIAGSLDDGFGKAQTVFVDVGQGSCIHIKTETGKHILIDGGGSPDYDVGKKTVMPYLLKNGCRKVDLVVLTHLDEDHYGGIRSLAKEGMVERIGLFSGNEVIEEKLSKETGLEEERFLYLAAGDRVDLAEGVYMEMFWPDRDMPWEEEGTVLEEQNEYSLVVRVVCGSMSILATGDIGEDTERFLWDRYDISGSLKSDVVAVPHHGSEYSSTEEFIDMVEPEMAVVQVGNNYYGHPAPETIARYGKRDIMVLRNDRMGAVGIYEDEAGGIGYETVMDREDP